jgi:predicted  nucleic acid-binding Zn-ribbon protein
MAEDVETTETEEESESIWAKLGITDPDEQYEDETVAAEADAEKEDKAARKLDKRVDDLEQKFRQNKLQEAKDKFLDSADPLEADLFKAIAGDTKDPEALDHAITLVKDRAAKMKATMEEAEAQARDQVAKSWGVANPGRTPQPTDDEKKKLEEAIAKGDTVAGLHAIMDDDPFMSGAL